MEIKAFPDEGGEGGLLSGEGKLGQLANREQWIGMVTGVSRIILQGDTSPNGDFPPVVYLGVNFSQETGNFLALKPAVAPRVDAVCPDFSLVTPAPQGVRVDMEELGYLPHRQQLIHLLAFLILSYFFCINLT